jgi:hypothetical protein
MRRVPGISPAGRFGWGIVVAIVAVLGVLAVAGAGRIPAGGASRLHAAIGATPTAPAGTDPAQGPELASKSFTDPFPLGKDCRTYVALTMGAKAEVEAAWTAWAEAKKKANLNEAGRAAADTAAQLAIGRFFAADVQMHKGFELSAKEAELAQRQHDVDQLVIDSQVYTQNLRLAEEIEQKEAQIAALKLEISKRTDDMRARAGRIADSDNQLPAAEAALGKADETVWRAFDAVLRAERQHIVNLYAQLKCQAENSGAVGQA